MIDGREVDETRTMAQIHDRLKRTFLQDDDESTHELLGELVVAITAVSKEP